MTKDCHEGAGRKIRRVPGYLAIIAGKDEFLVDQDGRALDSHEDGADAVPPLHRE